MIVIFQCIEDRDTVYTYVRNLAKMAGKAGIRLEIPEHLRIDFRLLETHGSTVRSVMGENTRRSIRFNDVDLSLVLNVKTGEHDP